jgi:hypothetical protein
MAAGPVAAQRQVGQRIERVVEIEHELAPLHAVNVVGRPHRQARHRQLLRGAPSSCSMTMSPTSRDETARAERDHVERHHAAEHAPPRQPVAEDGDIADAVLQADDDDIRWCVPGDDIGHGSGIRALDRDQHDAGVLKKVRIFRQCEPIARDGLVKTFKTRRPQAVGFDFSDDARTRQQRNAAAAGRQHAADEAADAARPCNTDRLARNHFATYRVAPGFK